MSQQQKLKIRVPDRLLPGVYANQMIVRHTREEFLIDFVNRFPPEGVVTSRVILSPGHLKRMIRALSENLGRYETSHGTVHDPTEPKTDQVPDKLPSDLPRANEQSPADAPDDDRIGPLGLAPNPAQSQPSEGVAQGSEPERAQQQRKDAIAKVPEETVAGVYANQMMVSHSREEFLIDFVNVFPPDAVVTSRVFVSPEQLKRMIRALQDNFGRYELNHGTIIEANVPQPDSYLN